MMQQVRKRPEPKDMNILYDFSRDGLSLRNTPKATSFCVKIIARSHTAIRDQIQKYKLKRLSYNI
ncbi:MAG TPA: hypothetical protein VN703_08075 [Candidatus Sulfopaludibacter sp.]|jgi:hypothetical protein|nr:hypothetical protein [Candidatus Sulfopaludibacter sp.]